MTTKSHIEAEPDPDVTGHKQVATQFQKGTSGNPSGRPRGSRNKLATGFLDELNAQFQEHGAEVIAKVRQRSPEVFFKTIAALLPREIVVASLNANVTVDLDALEESAGFLQAYRFARDRIGAVPLIEAAPIHADEGAVHTEAWKSTDDD